MISLSPSEFSNTTCLSCDAASVNRTFDYTNRSVIERSIVFDWQNFIVNSIMFDWVQQSNDWCSIGFDWIGREKCCRPFYTDKRQTWEGDVRNSRWAGQSIPENAGLFWFLYQKKILCKLKQLNSWTGDKQLSPAIVWQLSTATSAGPLHFFIRFSERSVVCHNGSHYGSCRYLIYYWFTIRFSVWSLLMRT